MNKKKSFSSKNRLMSFVYAYRGIIYLIKSQENVIFHLIATFMAILLGFLLKINATEWCLIVFAIGFVLVSETLNTAIESFIDFISPSYNFSAGKAKDLAAGAVLFSAITAAIIGLIVFLPKIIDLL